MKTYMNKFKEIDEGCFCKLSLKQRTNNIRIFSDIFNEINKFIITRKFLKIYFKNYKDFY